MEKWRCWCKRGGDQYVGDHRKESDLKTVSLWWLLECSEH